MLPENNIVIWQFGFLYLSLSQFIEYEYIMFLKPSKTRSSEGVYFLLTNLQEKDENQCGIHHNWQNIVRIMNSQKSWYNNHEPA